MEKEGRERKRSLAELEEVVGVASRVCRARGGWGPVEAVCACGGGRVCFRHLLCVPFFLAFPSLSSVDEYDISSGTLYRLRMKERGELSLSGAERPKTSEVELNLSSP